eukprot:gene30030-37180_t
MREKERISNAYKDEQLQIRYNRNQKGKAQLESAYALIELEKREREEEIARILERNRARALGKLSDKSSAKTQAENEEREDNERNLMSKEERVSRIYEKAINKLAMREVADRAKKEQDEFDAQIAALQAQMSLSDVPPITPTKPVTDPEDGNNDEHEGEDEEEKEEEEEEHHEEEEEEEIDHTEDINIDHEEPEPEPDEPSPMQVTIVTESVEMTVDEGDYYSQSEASTRPQT